MTALVQELQALAEADHARQPACSWCGRAGEPYEHRGVRFDGLTACEGDRLCSRCAGTYLRETPALIRVQRSPDDPGVTYDMNSQTAAWSEKNIPGCRGEVPVQAIAVRYRYAS